MCGGVGHQLRFLWMHGLRRAQHTLRLNDGMVAGGVHCDCLVVIMLHPSSGQLVRKVEDNCRCAVGGEGPPGGTHSMDPVERSMPNGDHRIPLAPVPEG
jgi:hypothetical protein